MDGPRGDLGDEGGGKGTNLQLLPAPPGWVMRPRPNAHRRHHQQGKLRFSLVREQPQLVS